MKYELPKELTPRKPKRRSSLLRRIVIAIAFFVIMPIVFVWLVNQQWAQIHALRLVNMGSSTQFALGSFVWSPLTGTIEITKLGFHNEKKGTDATIDSIHLDYSMLGFLRGKFVVKELKATNVSAVFPPGEKDKAKKPRKNLNIGKLLLLHTVIIEEATLDNVVVAFGKSSTYRMIQLTWSLRPRFTGDTTLKLAGKSIKLHKDQKPLVTADAVSLEASTTLSRWNTEFPYLNAVNGSLDIENAVIRTIKFNRAQATLSYVDGAVDLKQLEIKIGENTLTGKVTANIYDESFDIDINIPKPIDLPHFGKDSNTIHTAGKLTGTIQLKGKGFLLANSEGTGKGNLKLAHRFHASPDEPVNVKTPVRWKNGIISFDDARITVGEAAIDAKGAINIPGKKMRFDVEGKKFPIEYVFDKFKNPHLQKIYGATDATGTFEGWGKNFMAEVEATTYDGGFLPIMGERIITNFTATYNKLGFDWKLFQGDTQTGTAKMALNIGTRMADGKRAKSIEITADLKNHQLEPSFPNMGLTGIADGNLAMKGPIQSFTGTAKGHVITGSWLGVPIDEATTDIALTKPKITFSNITITPKSLHEITCTGPLVMDILTGQFHMHGEPVAGLDIDLRYTYDPKRVDIARITYHPPDRPGDNLTVKGMLVSGGAINLNSNGNFDLSIINPISAWIREATGPVDMKMRIGGTTTSPAFFGTIAFNNNTLSPRPIRLAMEDLQGTLRFDGHRIHFENLSGLAEDGSFALSGWLEHYDFKPSRANLTMEGKEFTFRTEDNYFRMEFDGTVALEGAFPHPLLKGNINILDGRYTKDFVILEQLGGGKKSAAKPADEITFDPRLDLTVHNSGDLMIKNNVGEIDLAADMTIRGTRIKPQISGSVSAREGRIDYMGLKFDITRGFVEFRGPYAQPYLEIEADRELRLYNLTLRMYGPIDNLALDLGGTSPSGPLEKRDVVSLLAFGITEQERREHKITRSGEQIGVSVAAQQVGQMIERPVTEMTHLDIFRVEAAEQDTDYDEPGKVTTRLRVGKQLTDRLSVDFATDIDTRDAEQTVTTEYSITDNVIIKGSRSSENLYKGNIGLRFRIR